MFDMCNILYDNTVWRRWLLKVLSRIGVHTSYRMLFRVWDRDYLAAVHRGEISFPQAFESFLTSIGLSRGQIDEVKGACQSQRREFEATVRPLPGVKNTLMRLQASGLVLGAVGNSLYDAAALRQRLIRFGMERRFAAVISSIDLRSAMPEAVCYTTVAGQMGLPLGEIAFVGHDTAELAGARALGMQTLAFNYDPDAEADVFLGRFDELLSAVVVLKTPLAA